MLTLASGSLHSPAAHLQADHLSHCWLHSRHRRRLCARRWEALQTALEAAVDTAGDMGAYRRRIEEGTWWWITSATDVVPATKRNCGTW